MLRCYVLILALTLAAGAAATEEEIVVNGGFETGQLTPWVAEKFVVGSGWSHSGNYAAAMAGGGYEEFEIEGYIKQSLQRTYYPGEVTKAFFWIYPDFNARGNGRGPCWTFYEFRLGDYNIYDVPPPEWPNWWDPKWYKIEMPLSNITAPFNYIYIWVKVEAQSGALPPYWLSADLDDISVTISSSAISNTSLGRVKAFFR